jgi:TonB family protein
LIRFDIDDRYQDEPLVGTAISRREAALFSVVCHSAILALIWFAPEIPFVQRFFERRAQELELMREQQRQMRPEENRTFVFVQPRVDIESPKPPPRAELSDKDRTATAPEQAPNPTNPLPFNRGNSSERAEAAEMARARGPESPAPPSPGDVVPPQPQPATPPQQRLPPSDTGLTVPPEVPQQQTRAGSGALGEALRNLQRYVQKESFDNPNGGGQFGPFIQFDTKGVEFGPWVRRFVAQVKRNWFIPYAAMTMRGHVVLQFNVHKDGRITDVAVVAPSNIDAFNNAAANAILTSNPTEPLPPEYPADKAFFTVTFYYNEEPPGR